MKTPASEFVETISQPSEEEIAALAHELWKLEGHPHGKAEEHWRRAEAQLRGEPAETEKEPKVV
jgi:hypothetical protein